MPFPLYVCPSSDSIEIASTTYMIEIKGKPEVPNHCDFALLLGVEYDVCFEFHRAALSLHKLLRDMALYLI